jgi:hypothetical protein
MAKDGAITRTVHSLVTDWALASEACTRTM